MPLPRLSRAPQPPSWAWQLGRAMRGWPEGARSESRRGGRKSAAAAPNLFHSPFHGVLASLGGPAAGVQPPHRACSRGVDGERRQGMCALSRPRSSPSFTSRLPACPNLVPSRSGLLGYAFLPLTPGQAPVCLFNVVLRVGIKHFPCLYCKIKWPLQ